MIPKDVNVNRKVNDPAAISAGFKRGKVTRKNVLTVPAPKVLAAYSGSKVSCPHHPPSVRTTIAVLKKTWATIIPRAVPSRLNMVPSSLNIVFRDRKADATTTVGITKGIVASTLSAPLPRKLNRLRIFAINIPTHKEIAVDIKACHSVNHITFHVVRAPNTVAIFSGDKPYQRIFPRGKK